MADIKISELTSASQLDGTEECPIVQGNSTVKVPLSSIAALAGAGYKVKTGTLIAGSTSITLQDAAITNNCLLAPFTDLYGVNPIGMTSATGSVTLTFEAQQIDVGIAVVIIGGAS